MRAVTKVSLGDIILRTDNVALLYLGKTKTDKNAFYRVGAFSTTFLNYNALIEGKTLNEMYANLVRLFITQPIEVSFIDLYRGIPENVGLWFTVPMEEGFIKRILHQSLLDPRLSEIGLTFNDKLKLPYVKEKDLQEGCIYTNIEKSRFYLYLGHFDIAQVQYVKDKGWVKFFEPRYLYLTLRTDQNIPDKILNNNYKVEDSKTLKKFLPYNIPKVDKNTLEASKNIAKSYFEALCGTYLRRNSRR